MGSSWHGDQSHSTEEEPRSNRTLQRGAGGGQVLRQQEDGTKTAKGEKAEEEMLTGGKEN